MGIILENNVKLLDLVFALPVLLLFTDQNTQKVTAVISAEEELSAAVSTAKVVLFLRSVLTDLPFPPSLSTMIYEDNKACIKIINARHPTDRTLHIDIPFF